MGFLDWFKRLFRPPARDVSTLASGSSRGGLAPDVLREDVEVDGGPLKPEHHRRALRDPRLLPKRRLRLPLTKRPKFMPADEARRLFSPTLRTRNRALMVLRADELHLERLGLPVWRTEEDVARALGLSVSRLRWFASHRLDDRVSHYVTFAVPKRSGGERLISAPKRELKQVLRTLDQQLGQRLPVSDVAHGFRKGRSTRTAAEPHVGRNVVVRLDVKDCFPSLTFGRVRGLFVAKGYSYPVAATLAALVTEAIRQPVEIDGSLRYVPVGQRHCVQGAPTSPALCNALLRKLDNRLEGLADHLGFVYTRYADDLSFSGDEPERVGELITLARLIAREEGFPLNDAKTLVMHRGRSQRVVGVTVNDTLGLSRRERRLIRAAIHREAAAGDEALSQRIDGQLAYLQMLNPEQADQLRARRKA